jgi:hypothetical protein
MQLLAAVAEEWPLERALERARLSLEPVRPLRAGAGHHPHQVPLGYGFPWQGLHGED